MLPVPGTGEMSVIVETSKVAMSPGPFGTVLGVQFAAVYQSPLVGLRFQVALSAWANCSASGMRRNASRRADRLVGLVAGVNGNDWGMEFPSFVGLLMTTG